MTIVGGEERARRALEHACAIQIECLDAKADKYFVLDRSKAEPEVNWPGESLSQIVTFGDAKRIRDDARAKVMLTFAAEASGIGVPEGFALVPVQPTPEMITAAETCDAADIWRVMLAASISSREAVSAEAC